MDVGVGGVVPAWATLAPGERIVVHAHTNRAQQGKWALLVGAVVIANVIVAVLYAGRGNAPAAAGSLLWAVVIFIAGTLLVARNSDVIATGERVIARGRKEIYLRDIQTVTLRQTKSGRRRNYGDVILRGNGRRITFRMITNAGDLQQAVRNGSHGRAVPIAGPEWERIAMAVVIYGVFFVNVLYLH